MSSVTLGSAAAAHGTVETASRQTLSGLDVLFRGVEVYEIRPRSAIRWQKTARFAGLAILSLLTIVLWTGGAYASSGGELSGLQVQQGVIFTGLTALYGIWLVRRSGVAWRFDHKRKTITRRHWLRGMSRRWNAKSSATNCGFPGCA